MVDLGNGDLSLALGSEDNGLVVDASNFAGDLSIVFSSVNGTSTINGSAVAVVSNSNYNILGNSSSIISMTPKKFNVWSGIDGVCAVIADGLLVARIAISLSEDFSTLFALPLPICAVGDGVTALPMTINGDSPNKWAGWQSALPAGGVVRMTGFNLPRTLTSHSGATQSTINAEGGDYGIEFTIPQDSDKVDIFDETFWLYIAPYI